PAGFGWTARRSVDFPCRTCRSSSVGDSVCRLPAAPVDWLAAQDRPASAKSFHAASRSTDRALPANDRRRAVVRRRSALDSRSVAFRRSACPQWLFSGDPELAAIVARRWRRRGPHCPIVRIGPIAGRIVGPVVLAAPADLFVPVVLVDPAGHF